ncbi:MAG TPA: hypothetical protein VKD90_09195 [Gemmataceae bacterium]|nr:hypothetical protein [Gemmataceae bacterium]
MHLIAPDILAEARGLSVGASATGTVLGLLLWLFGWRWHRFWTVAGVTIAGGLYGLSSGQPSGGHVIAGGILLAVCAGLLALELARLCAFAAGGTAAWLAAGTVLPNSPEAGLCFLAGGLVALVFYRLWMMALMSFLGTVLVAYSGLVLLESLTSLDTAAWAGRNGIWLTVAVGLVSLLGLAAQGAQARWRDDREPGWKPKAGRRRRRATDGDDLPPDLQDLRDTFRRKASE